MPPTPPGPTPLPCAIAVMAKLPVAGRSKTRLCPPLEPHEAASLSAAFLRDTTENLREAAALSGTIAPYAAFAPAGAEPDFAPHLAPGTGLVPADGSGGDGPGVEGFGRCLLHAVRGLLARGHRAAAVLSSDSPTLPTRLLVETARLLLEPGERVVFGPAEDGGYWLLGVHAAEPRMFADISWSTASVADVTRDRIRALGLPLVELETWYDVDDAASLERLRADTTGYAAPLTRAALARLDRARDARPLDA